MTSAISLRKVLKLQVKERNWLTILISIVCFLALPVFYTMRIQMAGQSVDPAFENAAAMIRYQRAAEAIGLLGADNVFINLCVIVAAFLTAFSCFIWLYQKEKSDFYLGLAIRREKQFDTLALAGAVIAVLPYLAATLVCIFVISPLFGVLSPGLIGKALAAMAWRVLSYFAVYFVVITALLLSGRHLPGLLISAFFLGYIPCLLAMIILMMGSFSTYYTSFIDRTQLPLYLSPVTLLFGPMWRRSSSALLIIVAVMAVYAGGGYLLSRYLYRVRPSETAGAPLTFPKMMVFLKVIVTIPCAIASGLFTSSISMEKGTGWMVFGCLMGAVVVGGIMEFIESGDLKAITAHWKSTALAAACGLLVLFLFKFDPFGYDTYLPAKDKVKAMAVSEEQYMAVYGCYNSPGVYSDDGGSFSELDLLDMGRTEDFDALYSLAEEGVAWAKAGKARVAPTAGDGDIVYENLIVMYELNSGRKVYRRYNVEQRRIAEAALEMAGQPDFKAAMLPFRYLNPDAVNMVAVENYEYFDGESRQIPLNETNRKELFEALKADAEQVSYQALINETPLATLLLQYNTARESWVYKAPFGKLSGMQEFYVYPSYTRTLAVLGSLGYTRDLEAAKAGIFEMTLDVPGSVELQNGDVRRYSTSYRIGDPEAIKQVAAVITRSRQRVYGRDFCEMRYRTSTGSDYGYTIKVTDPETFDSLLEKFGTVVRDGRADVK